MPIFDKHKDSVPTDAWDWEAYQDTRFDVGNLEDGIKKLHKKHDYVPDAYNDLFQLLYQGDPELRDPKYMEDSHLFNHAISDKFKDMDEVDELRTSTKYDPYTTAFALVSMEEDIRKLFEEQQEIQDTIQQLIQMAKEQQEKWDKMSPEEKQAMQAVMDALREQLKNELANMDPKLQEAIKRANQQIQDDWAITKSFGIEDGELRRMSYKERRELMEKLKSARMMTFSKMLGQFKMVARSARRKKAKEAPDEIIGVTMGVDLAKLTPSELAYMACPETEDLFWMNWVNHNLVQFRTSGKESLGSGPVLVICDESGSMSANMSKGGSREMWSKAFTLALQDQCKKNKRDFYYLGFSSERQLYEAEFINGKGPMSKVIDLVEHFFGGGTQPQPAIKRAMQIIREAPQGKRPDVVFISDGFFQVYEEDLKKAWNDLRSATGAQCFGVTLECEPEGLTELCDAIIEVTNMTSDASVMGDVFKKILN